MYIKERHRGGRAERDTPTMSFETTLAANGVMLVAADQRLEPKRKADHHE